MAEGLHRPVAGVSLMCAAMVLLTASDAAAKLLKADYSAGQIIFIRAFLALLILLTYAGATRRLRRLRIRSWRQQLLRGGFSVSGTFLFITALGLLPLADAVALTFAGPLFVGALAGPVLGERVGWRRWTAIVVGFIGIIIILRPGGSAWQWALLLPLCVAATDGARDLLTRHMAMAEDSLSTMIVTFSCVGIVSLFTIPFGWRPLTMDALPAFLAAGVFFTGAHFLMIESLRQAEAGLAVPYKYTSMVWAVILGVLLWDDWPDLWVITGSVIIIASGIYVFHRERLVLQRPALHQAAQSGAKRTARPLP